MKITKLSNQIVLFCLHGLGGSTKFWEPAIREIGGILPYNIKFILPQAKIIRFNFHETYYFPLFLPGWYNIESRVELAEGESDYGLLATIAMLDQLIAEEIALGISSQNIFVIGFSQGGSVALSMAMVSQYKLAGIISLAGFLPYHKVLEKVEKSLNKLTPILMLHGEKDWIVPCKKGWESAEVLQNYGYQLEFKIYPQAGHFDLTLINSDLAETEIVDFLKRILTKKEIVPVPNNPKITTKIVKLEEKSSWAWLLGRAVSSPLTVYQFFKKKKKTDSTSFPNKEEE